MIYKLEEGVFFSKLVCNNGDKEYSIDSRTSDAVALALRFGCPIFITEEILEKAGITINPTEGDASPTEEAAVSSEGNKYDTYTDDELLKLIDDSIKSEDYERAAAVRDELEKRKKRKKK
jgi:bifunctional DNase/RNase